MSVGTGLGLRQRKYAVLLALLCVEIAIESVSSRGAARFVSDAVVTLLAVAIWFVVFTRPRERVAMAALLVANHQQEGTSCTPQVTAG